METQPTKENKPSKLDKLVKISIMAGALIIALSVAYYLVFYIPQRDNAKKEQQAQKLTAEVYAKKQALADFYNEISQAEKIKDWGKLYELSDDSLKNNVTLEQFINYHKKKLEEYPYFSKETTVHDIKVDGDNGIVDRTITTCLTELCSGDDRKEDHKEKRYVYVNGAWQMPDPEPSERALKDALYIFNSFFNDTAKKAFLTDWGYGSTNKDFAIRNWAVYLDENKQVLLNTENAIEEIKANKNKPTVNVQQPSNSSSYCRSHFTGDHLVTTCF